MRIIPKDSMQGFEEAGVRTKLTLKEKIVIAVFFFALGVYVALALTNVIGF